MEKYEKIYRKLQKHLDRQAVGFPATRARSEIKILKHIFSPRDAEIAVCLSYKPEPLEIVFERAGHLFAAPRELAEALDRIHSNGGIESRLKDGRRVYCNVPLVVGMYEMQLDRLTPEFIKDFHDYTGNWKFGIEFLGTDLPQMRTIPISRSIRPEHHAATFDEATTLLQQAEAPFAVLDCICRKKKEMEGAPCKVTDRKESCLAMGGVAQSVLTSGAGREVSRDEALGIIAQNQAEGLVLQPSNTQKADFICSCCGCCCGMLSVHRKLPKPLQFWSSNFQATVQAHACDGCGACARRCQVGAVRVAARRHPAEVDADLCIGCGLCVTACPKGALSLFKKPAERRPPQTREDLYEIIMANKKSGLQKLKLGGKLFIDAIQTGRTGLLKSS